MPIFDRRSGEPSQPQGTSTPARRFTDHEGIETVLGAEARFQGTITGKTHLEIKGQLEGNCQIEGLVRISEGGSVVGDVSATDIVVEGRVQGNLCATNKLELRSSSEIEGDVRSATIAMAEGCSIEGHIDMSRESGSPGGSTAGTFKEKRQNSR